MNKFKFILPGLFLLLLGACVPKKPAPATGGSYSPVSTLAVKYAGGFTVAYYEGYKVISVRDLKDSSLQIAQYILMTKGTKIPTDFDQAVRIEAPVSKVVCVSTTHMAEMARLGLTDSIAAVTNSSLIYNTDITGRVKSGAIANLGNSEVNYEKLVELAPAYVITSGGYDGGDKLKIKLAALRINSVIDLDYMEQNPLARAEWIKFIAAFYDREQEADSIFRSIETNYLFLRAKVQAVGNRPSVFCNLPFKEVWYMPCGENYMAKLIEDAGGDFIWKDAAATNGLNLNLDYEAVYSRAANADVWLNTGFAGSLAEIKAADTKNGFFKAYKTGSVYNNNKRNTPSGGFDFWESGIVSPDLILADMIYIFHPELMTGHELYYYQKLK